MDYQVDQWIDDPIDYTPLIGVNTIPTTSSVHILTPTPTKNVKKVSNFNVERFNKLNKVKTEQIKNKLIQSFFT